MMTRKSTAEIEKPAWEDKHGPHEGDDWLTSFKSEGESVTLPPASARASARQPSSWPRFPFLVIGICASLAGGGIAWQTWTATPAASAPLNAPAATGTADFKSVPEGASITIDGTVRGVTPLRVSLAAGSHTVQITSGQVTRTLPITVEPGALVSQYVELAAAAPTGGRLEIGSEPSGARVALDGVSRGVTPLVLADVAPGQHRVTVSAGDSTVVRTVNITAGTTSTLLVSTAASAAGASGGWLTTQSPLDMDILEDGRVLGSTRMERLMLPVGSHVIEFSSPALEFTVSRTVQIAAGRTATISIAPPSGRLSVNAVPWADVSLDGASLGTTPLGDVAVPIGTHELVLRHPQFGERRQTITVKAQTPTRIGIDLRK